MSRSLEGVVVVDLSLQLPGPYCTLLLASLGARVIKIEPPGGDPAREIDPEMFERVNAGKEIFRADLKTEHGRHRVHDLVRAADVFVEGFRPGVTERLGVGWTALREINPDIVYCSLSGFGAEGPLARRAGHDLNFLGLAAGVGPGDGDGESLIRVPFVDLASGTSAALAIVAALLARPREGGRHLEMAMLDSALAWSLAKLPREDGAEGAYGVFATSDGRHVAVAVLELPMWRRLCTALGWEDWASDSELDSHDARRAHAADITARLDRSLAARSLAEIEELADRYDLGITAVNSVPDLAEDPQVATRGVIATVDGWAPLGPVGSRVPLASADREAPALGEELFDESAR